MEAGRTHSLLTFLSLGDIGLSLQLLGCVNSKIQPWLQLPDFSAQADAAAQIGHCCASRELRRHLARICSDKRSTGELASLEWMVGHSENGRDGWLGPNDCDHHNCREIPFSRVNGRKGRGRGNEGPRAAKETRPDSICW